MSTHVLPIGPSLQLDSLRNLFELNYSCSYDATSSVKGTSALLHMVLNHLEGN